MLYKIIRIRLKSFILIWYHMTDTINDEFLCTWNIIFLVHFLFWIQTLLKYINWYCQFQQTISSEFLLKRIAIFINSLFRLYKWQITNLNWLLGPILITRPKNNVLFVYECWCSNTSVFAISFSWCLIINTYLLVYMLSFVKNLLLRNISFLYIDKSGINVCI